MCLRRLSKKMRVDVLDLRDRRPDLAMRFVQLRAELDTPLIRDASSTDRNSASSWQVQARQRHKASSDFDTLLVEIRTQEGFDDFLLAPNEGSMRAAASHGPIVIINVSDHRCDAILVEQHQIRSLALLNLHRMDIEKKKEEGTSSSWKSMRA